MARVGEWIPAHPGFGRYTLSVRLDLALTQRPFAALQLSEGLVAERLDVAPMVVGDERFDPVVCAQGDERVKERRSAVVQADTVYSSRSHGGARCEIDRIDKSFDRRCIVAGECKTGFWAQIERAIGIQYPRLGFGLEATGFDLIAAMEAGNSAVQEARRV